MGYEYTINLNQPVPAVIDQELRACPFFDCFDGWYYFRWGDSKEPGMASAWVGIQEPGLYICLTGGPRQSEDFIGYLRTLVVDKLGQPFVMEDL